MRQVPSLVLELDGGCGSVLRARLAARSFLTQVAAYGLRRLTPGLRADVVLVVSELVSNACRHAPGPCRLSLAVTPDGVDVAVEDTGCRLLGPVPRPGRSSYGLLLVTTLGHGVHVLPTATGKIVQTTVHT